MDIRTLTGELSVSPQLTPDDLRAVAEAGYRTIVCNRPDGEAPDQPGFAEIERSAAELGLQARYLPAEPGKVSMDQATAFAQLMAECPKPVLAYCRSGLRSATMWALSQAQQMPLPHIVERGAGAGFDLQGVVRRIGNRGRTPADAANATHEVVIVGGDAGPSPSRLLAAAVANCLSANLLFALRKFHNDPGTLRAHARMTLARNDAQRLRVQRIDDAAPGYAGSPAQAA